ncbi:hypothetical protein N0V90_001889 [Kalmusia sp. IMI 367209]|nr:hypothetical protein N0V90_001889 [Kalmusia sp. IMI 367209]
MGVLKGLFLGVYGSNGVIRVLFLPLCYLLLSSPFILVLARYYQFDSRLFEVLGKEKSLTDIALQVFVGLIAFLLPTRILSGKNWDRDLDGGKRRVQQIPYWIPGDVRESAFAPIIAYNTAGAKHNIILSPSLLEQLHGTPAGLNETDVAEWDVLRNAFNMPKNTEVGYFELRPKLSKAVDDNIFNTQSAEKLLSASLSILTDSLPDLVTFNSSILLASDLSAITELYYGLATGLPRLCPIPGLPAAILAKKRLSQNFERLFDELEHPKKRVPDDDESMSGEETDADTPTPLTAMNEFFSKNEVPIQARAAMTLQSIYSLVSDIVPLTFWVLINKLITVAEPESIRPGVPEQWELDAGSYLDIGLSQTLINTSSANFIAPNEFKPDRFQHTAPPSSVTSPSDPQESLETSLLVAFIAGVLQLWEISPAPKKSFFDHMQEAQAAAMGPVDGKSVPTATSDAPKKVGEWVVPRAVDGAAVKVPKGDVRVRIRRREGLPGRRSLRKGR